MNPTSLASPTHYFDEDEPQLTGKEGKEAAHPNSDEEGKFGLDLNYPNVDPATGYTIVDGAIYIDSDDDEDVDIESRSDREEYRHTITRTKYETEKGKGKDRVVESEEDGECDSWLTLGFCAQILGSPSATKAK